jgi:dethiobiotin synthase
MSPSQDPGVAILVTGTDLGVGKTFVAAGLARLMRERGIDVGVMKPVETGWPKENGRWPTDAEELRDAAGSDDPIEDVVPYIYEDPVAPQVAADHVRQPIELEKIQAALQRLRERHDVVLVEGAGGIAVPLDDGLDFASLADRLDRSSNDPSAPTNASMISRMCDVPVLGVVPFRYDADTLDQVTSTCRACFDLDRFLELAGLPSGTKEA